MIWLVGAVLVDSFVTLLVGLKLKGWAVKAIQDAAAEMTTQIAGEISGASHTIVTEFINTAATKFGPLLMASKLGVTASGHVEVHPDEPKSHLRKVTES